MAFRGPNSVRTRITVDGSSLDALHFQLILSVCTIILYANTMESAREREKDKEKERKGQRYRDTETQNAKDRKKLFERDGDQERKIERKRDRNKDRQK